MSSAMSDIVGKIMIEVLSVLALATKQINQGRFSEWYWHTSIQFSTFERAAEKFAKKILRESDVEAVLQRLDRLTQEEARVALAHTLEVVHGLFDNLKVVMDGVSIPAQVPIKRLMRVDGKATTDGIRKALGRFDLRGTSNFFTANAVSVMVQETADRINKLERKS